MNIIPDLNDLDIQKRRHLWYIMSSITLILIISWLGILDTISFDYIDSSLVDAGLAYGTAKLLNSIISTIQSTSVGIMFANVTLGEALDPFNDLIEQYSSLMELSIGSLLIQKILLEIVSAKFFKILITFLGIGFISALLLKKIALAQVLSKIFLTFFFVRFALALVVLMNWIVGVSFIDEKIESQTLIIEKFPGEFESIQAQKAMAIGLQKEMEKEVEDLELKNSKILKEINSVEAEILIKSETVASLTEELDNKKSSLPIQDRLNPFTDNESLGDTEEKLSIARSELKSLTETRSVLKDSSEDISDEVEDAKNVIENGEYSFLGKITNGLSSIKSSFVDVSAQFQPSVLIDKFSEMTSAIISAMTVFILKTLILPLLFLFMITKTFRLIWNYDMGKLYFQK
jgi:hypothetical protein